MEANISVGLKPFSVPNFVITEGRTMKTTDGEFIEAPKYRLADLDEITLEKLCDKFKADIFTKAKKDFPVREQEAKQCRNCGETL